MSHRLSAAELKALGDQYLMRLTRYWPDDPLVIVSARGAHLHGRDGSQYLDMFGGVATVVEYGNPRIIAAQRVQLEEGIVHLSELYYHEMLFLAAQRLADLMPEGLKRTRFTNSGTEANQLAAEIVMRKTGRTGLLSLMHAYHGRGSIPAALTFQQGWRNMSTYPANVHFVPNPYAFRRPDGMSKELFYEWCLEQTEQIIRHALGGRLAGLWVEPIQGNGGVVQGPTWYYDRLVQLVHKYGGFVIADEVQTGVGRTGKWLNCLNWKEKPDIVVMAKALANGMPIGSVTTTDEIAKSMDDFLDFNTFGGGPLACATMLANLDVVEGYGVNIGATGEALYGGLETVGSHHEDVVGDVRGEGLMLGVEFVVRTHKHDSPNTALMTSIHRAMRDRHVLVGKGGPDGNVMRIKPPYCLTQVDVNTFLGALDESITLAKTA